MARLVEPYRPTGIYDYGIEVGSILLISCVLILLVTFIELTLIVYDDEGKGRGYTDKKRRQKSSLNL